MLRIVVDRNIVALCGPCALLHLLGRYEPNQRTMKPQRYNFIGLASTFTVRTQYNNTTILLLF